MVQWFKGIPHTCMFQPCPLEMHGYHRLIPRHARCRGLPAEQTNRSLTCFIVLWKLELLLQLHMANSALSLMRCHAPEQGFMHHTWLEKGSLYFSPGLRSFQNTTIHRGRIKISGEAGCIQGSPIPFKTLSCSFTFKRLYCLNTSAKLANSRLAGGEGRY